MIHSRFEARQKQSLHQVPILTPTLILVRHGEKRVYNGRDEVYLPAGKAIVLPAGITPEMENIPANGFYASDVFSPPRSWLERFRQQYGALLAELPMRQDSFFSPDPVLELALQSCCQPTICVNDAWQKARLELAWHQVLLELIRLRVAAAFFMTSSQPLADRLQELINFSPSQAWQANQVAQQLGMSTATASFAHTSFADSTAFTLQSVDITDGKPLTKQQEFSGFGCDGGNHSPALSWSGVPAGTKSLALTVYDPDAPTGSGWWHWVVFNIPADATSLPANIDASGKGLPAGAVQSRTDFGQAGFGGACPPQGDKPHHYHFTLHALKTDKLDLTADAMPAMVGFMLHANELGNASLTATYARSAKP